MNSITTLIPANWIEAIGWTLIHSLWQGLLIGLLAWPVLRALQNFSARIRYRVAFAALLLIPVLAGVTLARVYEPAVAVSNEPFVYVFGQPYVAAEAPAAAEAVFSWMSLMPWMVAAWLLGAAFFLLRFAGGFVFVQRLRFGQHSKLPFHVQASLNNWIHELGVGKKVRIAESALVKSPVLIGYIRPIVLLPLGCAAGLPKEQLEALLVHELAHVLRHDFILNVIQEIVRMFFFFHPVTWWLNNVIRDERENCCDDIAFRAGVEKIHLAGALASLEEQKLQHDELLLAAAGRNNLLQRIRRMFRTETAPTPRERVGASVLLLAGLLLVTTSVSLAQAYKEKQDEATTADTAAGEEITDGDDDGDTTKTSKRRSKNKAQDHPAPPAPPLPPMPPMEPFSPISPIDWFPNNNPHTLLYGDSVNFREMRIERDEKGNISGIFLDGKPADLSKLDTAALNRMERQEKELEKYWKQNEKEWKKYEQEMEAYGREMANYYSRNTPWPYSNPAELEKLNRDLEKLYIPELTEITMPPVHPGAFDHPHFNNGLADLAELAELQYHLAETNVRNARIDSLRALLEAEIARENARQMQVADERMKAHAEMEKAHERRSSKLNNAIESELQNDKLLGKKGSYNFRITRTELEINKKKMDSAMHKKYLAIVEKIMGTLSDDDSIIIINNHTD